MTCCTRKKGRLTRKNSVLPNRRPMMNMDVIKSFTEQMQGFAAPLTRYNQLLASNIEQLTRLQLASANAYAELGLNQLQAVGKVQDAQSLAALGTVQLESASQLSRQMLDDIQKLSTLGQQFKEELDALTADGIKKSTGKA